MFRSLTESCPTVATEEEAATLFAYFAPEEELLYVTDEDQLSKALEAGFFPTLKYASGSKTAFVMFEGQSQEVPVQQAPAEEVMRKAPRMGAKRFVAGMEKHSSRMHRGSCQGLADPPNLPVPTIGDTLADLIAWEMADVDSQTDNPQFPIPTNGTGFRGAQAETEYFSGPGLDSGDETFELVTKVYLYSRAGCDRLGFLGSRNTYMMWVHRVGIWPSV